MKKLDPGYYEIKPGKNKRPTFLIPKETTDDNTYSYIEKYYNDMGEECYEIKIHKGNPVKRTMRTVSKIVVNILLNAFIVGLLIIILYLMFHGVQIGDTIYRLRIFPI